MPSAVCRAGRRKSFVTRGSARWIGGSDCTRASAANETKQNAPGRVLARYAWVGLVSLPTARPAPMPTPHTDRCCSAHDASAPVCCRLPCSCLQTNQAGNAGLCFHHARARTCSRTRGVHTTVAVTRKEIATRQAERLHAAIAAPFRREHALGLAQELFGILEFAAAADGGLSRRQSLRSATVRRVGSARQACTAADDDARPFKRQRVGAGAAASVGEAVPHQPLKLPYATIDRMFSARPQRL